MKGRNVIRASRRAIAAAVRMVAIGDIDRAQRRWRGMSVIRNKVLLVLLMVGFFSAKLGAQSGPQKFVWVGPVLGGNGSPAGNGSPFFNIPVGVAIGPSGTTFVADPLNNRVVADQGAAGAAPTSFSSLPCSVPGCVTNPWTLSSPTYVATAPDGNLWISDTGNDVVIEINPRTGTVVRFAGVGPSNVVCGSFLGGGCPPHPNSGQRTSQFLGPGPLAVDKLGNVYVADGAGALQLGYWGVNSLANIRIQKFASNGSFLTSWGSWCDLNSPGSVKVLDSVYRCNTFARGAQALGDGQFIQVTGLGVDDSLNVYVADSTNNRVQKFTSVGMFLLKWGALVHGTSDGQFNVPAGIAVDFDQSVYVIDNGNNRIQQFDGSGRFLSKTGSGGPWEAEFNNPWGIAAVAPSTAQSCYVASLFAFLDPAYSDCIHGFVVSEMTNRRTELMAGRYDKDNDGITDEVDTNPNVFSNDFSNASLRTGFSTTGSIVNRGDQTFVIYGVLSPSPQDAIRIRTETFGGSTPLTLTACGTRITLSFPKGTSADFTCQFAPSTPAVSPEGGPVGLQFVGGDGTIANATLNFGNSVSVNLSTSTIVNIGSGSIVVNVGGTAVTLNPGQSTVVRTFRILPCPLCQLR